MISKIIHEKSNFSIPIPIPINQTYNNLSEYSLKQNCFDPSKSSPPNKFMINLHIRMSNYNSLSFLINEDNRDSE